MKRSRLRDSAHRGWIWWAALLLVACHAPARAQEISLQTELTYTLSETGLADGSSRSHGQFSPWYVLTLRGPLIGGTDTRVELGLTGYESGSPEVSVDQRNYRLSLFAQDARLSLMALAIRDVSRLTAARAEGGDRMSQSVSDTYSINGVLTYPSYPRLSFQYQKSTTPAGDGTDRESVSHAVGVHHDWGPLQLMLDDVKQESAFSQVSSESKRYGVSFDRSLLPTMRLRVDHYSDVGTVSYRGVGRTTASKITTARVSALPTPFLVLDGVLSYTEAENQAIGIVGGATSTGWGQTYNLRSEVLPGLRLEATRNSQEYRSSLGTTSWNQTSVDVGVRPLPTTTVLGHWSRATSADPITSASSDSDRRLSLTVALSPRVDLSANYGATAQAYGDGRRETSSEGLGLTGYVSPMLTVQTTVSQERSRRHVAQGSTTDTWRSFGLSAAWLPSELWHLGAGLSVSQVQGSGDSASVTPHLDLRWDMDPATTLALRYYAQRRRHETEPFGPAARGRSVGLTGSLRHQLPNGGSLELSYEYQKAASSIFTWERVLEIRHTRRF